MSDLGQGTTVSFGTAGQLGKLVRVETNTPTAPVDLTDLDDVEHVYAPGLQDDEIGLTIIGTATDVELFDQGLLEITWADQSEDNFADAIVGSKNKGTGVGGRIETRLLFKIAK